MNLIILAIAAVIIVAMICATYIFINILDCRARRSSSLDDVREEIELLNRTIERTLMLLRYNNGEVEEAE